MNRKAHAGQRPHRSAARGFSLIELMVAVTILAILAAVAFPSYRNHVVKTHRDTAKACLVEHAQFLERYYTTNLTYEGANPALGCQTESGMDDRYTFAADDLTATTYTLTATPIGAQATSDTKCGVLTLYEDGSREEGGSGDLADCW